MDSDPLARQVLLEDYRLWVRELEKQDRWLYQGIWTVLAASAGALYLINGGDARIRTPGALAIGLVAVLFIHANGGFLATRVATYRMVSRRVAALRRAARVFEILGSEQYRESGVPMLSDNPQAFVRSALAGSGRGYRSLLFLHVAALWMVYAMLAGFLWSQHVSAEVAAFPLAVGLLHYFAFAIPCRYHAAEAENLGSFLVSLARDYKVEVSRDAEDRLLGWMRDAQGSKLVESCPRLVRVVLAYEDKRFWVHPGVDPVAIAGRILGRRNRGGASTISMQLARQLVPNPLKGRKLRRKLFECFLGSWLVLRYGRTAVLAAWFTRVPYGRSSVIGIAAAAKQYFGKLPEDLDELDALLLAERVTVYTGRYYPDRIQRLATWAQRRGLITEEQRAAAAARYSEMQRRVPLVA
jgi:hypothetical protein